MQVSATIITLNEEENLRRACQSLQGVADEIVVVDAFSQDRTCEIAREFTPRVLSHAFENYSSQKNFAAAQAVHDWILSLDADECLSEGLRESLLELKKTGFPADVAGVRFSRRANYIGGWIKHSGWYPDFKVRLYDRTRARWAGEYVHESLVVGGQVESISGDLLHYTVKSISDHVNRLNRYTSLAAQQCAANGKRFSWLECLVVPSFTFFKTYFIQRGMLDGWRGLCIAALASWYVFLKQVKLWELTQLSGEKPSSQR